MAPPSSQRKRRKPRVTRATRASLRLRGARRVLPRPHHLTFSAIPPANRKSKESAREITGAYDYADVHGFRAP